MGMSRECIHSLGCKKNDIGEKITYCMIWGEWKNITLGDCFGNCEAQDPSDDFCSYGERKDNDQK